MKVDKDFKQINKKGLKEFMLQFHEKVVNPIFNKVLNTIKVEKWAKN